MNGLNIEDGIFAKMREDFNDILGGTVRELITKGGSDATLRVGLSISLDRQRVFGLDSDCEIENGMAWMPLPEPYCPVPRC